jgi:outer membrane protein OmpA-like peptidoglycan-associated protein
LKQDLFVDLAVKFNNIELSPATPYSGKYLGYAIDKGKLSLGLKYSIDKKQLQAQNDVLIDQLTFGNSVESKDATKLPVRLAVVLLRDNSGKIDLHLPISGRTDDPDFHVGKIIIDTIVNILKKAATSPFALLEALYPGSTELSFIGFEPGRSSLSEESKKKLDKVVQILTDRTALNLELSGYVDISSDKTGLNEYMLERRLKEQKLKDILRQGRQATSVDDIIIDQKEYSIYLTKAYKALDFQGKPKNVLGLMKSLPDDEMKKLMLENLKITDDDLIGLAEARAQKVRDYLVETGKIDPARIFLVKADAMAPEKIDKALNSRVSLSIK